jgi:hypothetical protein
MHERNHPVQCASLIGTLPAADIFTTEIQRQGEKTLRLCVSAVQVFGRLVIKRFLKSPFT